MTSCSRLHGCTEGVPILVKAGKPFILGHMSWILYLGGGCQPLRESPLSGSGLGDMRRQDPSPYRPPRQRLPNTKHHYEPCSGTNLGLGEQVKASQKVSGAQGEQGELAQSPRKCWAALGQGQ